jgi:GntR family transcriptional regulator, rspAB operon transcriptional repressor
VRRFGTCSKAIVTLELPPGVMVSERHLMERLGCSRAALRPALIRLSELGLIATLPRKGLVVTALDTFDVFEIYEARWAIEARVARLAAARVNDGQLEVIARLAEHPPAAARHEGNWTTFLERDQRLHLAVASAAGNRYLFDALTRVLPLSSRVWHWVYATVDTAGHIRYEHDDIVQALRERDSDAAEAAVTAHVEQARDMLRELFITQLAQAG